MQHRKQTSPLKSSAWRWKLGQAFGATIALVALSVPASAQDLPFDSGSTDGDGALDVPFHLHYRENFGVAYDDVRNEAVLFGGHWGGTYYPETWTLDTTSGVWTREAPANFVSGRRDHAMVYDPVSETTILFGGFRADGTYMNDMWAWDGTNWSEISPAIRPSPRADAVMAVQPATGNILLFGGFNGTHLNDTWLWNGTNWSLIPTVTTPGANFASYRSMVYHEDLNLWFMYNEWDRRTWTSDGTNWTLLTTGAAPDVGERFGMVYDSSRDEVLIHDGSSGTVQTWIFANGDWALQSPASVPNRRVGHGMFYNPDDQKTYITLGDQDIYYLYSADAWSTSTQRFSTWSWEGTTWSYLSGWLYTFDLGVSDANGDGIYDYSAITIPTGIQIRFQKGQSNDIVHWRSSGDVLINGYILVDGRDAPDNLGAGDLAIGGPGGGAGGVGGILFPVSGSYAGTGGIGPAGGLPGVVIDEDGDPGRFFGTYGNSAQQPTLAGSGGGGGASSDTANGGNGGGGGGAIIIESSGDIMVNGVINADGGRGEPTGITWGGEGSGGGIVLRADRVLGSGTLWARGGRSSTDTRSGRIRIEAFFRPLATRASPLPSATAPVESVISGATPTLSVISIDGVLSVQPPSGDQTTPDVVFADNQPVTIVVEGANIPAGTPITLRITGTGTIITLPAQGDADVTLDGNGQATFTATVPAGVGTVQAFATFTPETP